MLSPSLSLTFSAELSIIFRGFAGASAAFRRRFGKRLQPCFGPESGDFWLPRTPVTRPICLRDVSMGAIVSASGDLGLLASGMSQLLQWTTV